MKSLILVVIIALAIIGSYYYGVKSTYEKVSREWANSESTQNIKQDLFVLADSYNSIYNLCLTKYEALIRGNEADLEVANSETNELFSVVNAVVDKYSPASEINE